MITEIVKNNLCPVCFKKFADDKARNKHCEKFHNGFGSDIINVLSEIYEKEIIENEGTYIR